MAYIVLFRSVVLSLVAFNIYYIWFVEMKNEAIIIVKHSNYLTNATFSLGRIAITLRII